MIGLADKDQLHGENFVQGVSCIHIPQTMREECREATGIDKQAAEPGCDEVLHRQGSGGREWRLLGEEKNPVT